MDLIIHHYPSSPFAEKIRLMLGYTEMRWLSLESPHKPPRPNVDPLTGGYRRIPVAQLGADIFCDTQLIASEIAEMANKPLLAPENCSEEMLDFCHRAEGQVFIASFSAIPSRLAVPAMFRLLRPWQIPGFILDRMKMTQDSDFKLLPLFEARNIVMDHLIEMEARLEDEVFLFGPEPSLADFATYPTFWFLREISPELVPDKLTRVQQWLTRMALFGHGKSIEIAKNTAHEMAAKSHPRLIPEQWQASEQIGKLVTIAPDDYAKQPVRGELIAEGEHRWVIRRMERQFGTLHVHFPKQGYLLTAER